MKTAIIVIEEFHDTADRDFERRYSCTNSRRSYYRKNLVNQEYHEVKNSEEYWIATRTLIDGVITEKQYNAIVSLQNLDEDCRYRQAFWVGPVDSNYNLKELGDENSLIEINNGCPNCHCSKFMEVYDNAFQCLNCDQVILVDR